MSFGFYDLQVDCRGRGNPNPWAMVVTSLIAPRHVLGGRKSGRGLILQVGLIKFLGGTDLPEPTLLLGSYFVEIVMAMIILIPIKVNNSKMSNNNIDKELQQSI